MKFSREKSIWQVLAISGLLSALAFLTHVIMGGIFLEGYSHVRQTISELTGNGAPKAEMLLMFKMIYWIFAVVFSVTVFVLFGKYQVHQIARFGALLLVAMHSISLIGYSLFPLEQGGAVLTFGNLVHLAITAIVMIITVGALFSIGYGLWLTKNFRSIGLFTLFCGLIIVLAGVAAPIVLNNNLPYAGLVERFNIFTLQLWVFVLSLYLYRLPKIMEMGIKHIGLMEIYKER
ncbi:DUF998 domain-containing protein [Planococcus sp. CPCC 101016]|uniref:DUF998 domain-containing protein n=1 Tax=Planococcus sp. CPCC 101016 TaxID=2599617 RepID=UPI0011B46501|nr:DUF998 domain-containing protein [Planococcus sp. CPCC 101016]TWT07146.1 DUF998 domain-containing protein [Planococcus sp. CPCC 101016]